MEKKLSLDNVKKMLPSSPIRTYSPIILLALFIFLLYRMVHNGSSTHKNTMYSTMERNLKDIPVNIKTIYEKDAQHQHPLRDYYVLSSYNSCGQGEYHNGFVSLDALDLVLQRGVRVLDFEVYQIDNKPQVAMSTKSNPNFKTTFNSIDIDNVFKHIRDYAFNAGKVPNSNDPLFIHLRIQSQLRDCSEMTASKLKSNLSFHLLEPNEKKLYMSHVKDLLGKVIVMVNDTNPIWKSTSLADMTDIITGTQEYQVYRKYDIDNLHNPRQFMKHNQTYMAISVPDDSMNGKNQSFKKSQHYGVQFICMNFGTFDTHLEMCLRYFNQKRTAFSLKPDTLIYHPETVPDPKVPDIDMTRKEINLPYFKSTI